MAKEDKDISLVKREIKFRFSIIYVLVLVFALLIVIRIVTIQTIERSIWMEKASTYSKKDITLIPNRGDICAVDGKLLSSSLPSYNIFMDLKSKALKKDIFLKNVDSLALCLSNLFKDKSKDEYVKQLKAARSRGERYYSIKTKVNYPQLKKLKTFPIFRMGRYKGGFIYTQENTRVQPHNGLAERTIGYTTKGETGNVVGIEGAFDDELKGIEGIKLMQRLSGGIWMPVNDGNEVEPEDGKDVITTLDVNIQDLAESTLRKHLTTHNADHGSVVVMEVQTGEIKAITNLQRTKSGKYEETFNFAIGESTEPGSTFKLASIMAAMEDGFLELNDSVNTGDGKITYNGFTISDTKEKGHGRISAKQVFEVSSNVGVSMIINYYYKKNPRKFIDRLYSMNLNEKVGIKIKGEEKPYIKYPDDKLWSGISLVQMSIGYEVKQSPIQILTFYNAIANGGKMIRPKIVNGIRQNGVLVKTFETEVINPSICSKETLKKAQKMLLGLIENGTAKNIKSDLYKIAGKTGTAQLAKGKTGYHDENDVVSYQSSFVGYFPAGKPKYSIIVVMNSPSNDLYYGAVVAAPVFKEIADKIYASDYDFHPECKSLFANNNALSEIPYSKDGLKAELDLVLEKLEIPIVNKLNSTNDWIVTNARVKGVEYHSKSVKKGIVPQVEGMGLRDAIYLLEKVGLKVEVIGRGTVKKQSIDAGRAVNKGDRIILNLG